MELQQDVVDWLLEPSNPCVRLLSLRDILHRSPRSKECTETRARIPFWPPVAKILAAQRRNGGWDPSSIWYHPKYRSSVWQLIILSQTGIDPNHPQIEMMCEYAFRFQSDAGPFLEDRRKHASSDWASLAGCLNGNVIAALSRLGRDSDKRLERAVDSLVSIQEPDGGWTCRSFGYHKNDKHSCFMGTICALDALNEYARSRQGRKIKESIAGACEFLLMHRLFMADHHGFRPIRSDWTRLGSPYLVGYDIVRGLRALRSAGIGHDRRMDDALAIVREKRTINGRWIRDSRWPANSYSSFGNVGEEDKWVTLAAMQALSEH